MTPGNKGNAIRTTNLVLGAGHIDRELANAKELLQAYQTDDGLRYLEFEPSTPSHHLVPEDLAVTILINSRVGPSAFKSLQDRGAELTLKSLPQLPLESTTSQDRRQIAELLGEVASWPGFAASVATKIIHKKRPALVPILDNQAIFGAYMNPHWPERRSATESVYSIDRIEKALDWIWSDLTRVSNKDVWPKLQRLAPTRSLIEIFDMIWWTYFRRLEPVRPQSPV